MMARRIIKPDEPPTLAVDSRRRLTLPVTVRHTGHYLFSMDQDGVITLTPAKFVKAPVKK